MVGRVVFIDGFASGLKNKIFNSKTCRSGFQRFNLMHGSNPSSK